MNRVYIKTYGCQMNERDSDAVSAMLRGRGYCMVDNEQSADVVLLNTCSVRDQSEQKAIGKTGHLAKRKKQNPRFIIGVMGCMAQNRGEALLDSLPDLDLLVGTQKLHHVSDHLDQIIQSLEGQGPRPNTIINLDEEEGSQDKIRDHLENKDKSKSSAFVSIMQGCNMNCSFCIVPKTRGKERCRPIVSIVEEIEKLASSGTKEVTLLGQIVTSYGRGDIPVIDKKSPFVQLIEAIHEIPGIERIRFTSPHPCGFKSDLVEAYGRLSKLCPYVHLPMQSGSDKILKLMKRPYNRDRYQKIIDNLRAVVPDMYFSTDVIVGFPGETEADFDQTRELFEKNRFDMAFIFKYSPRSGTPAATMEDQVPQKVKEERNHILLKLLEKSSFQRNQSLIGTKQEVLVEGPARRENGMLQGRNPGNRKVIFSGKPNLIGQLVEVSIKEGSLSSVYGNLV